MIHGTISNEVCPECRARVSLCIICGIAHCQCNGKLYHEVYSEELLNYVHTPSEQWGIVLKEKSDASLNKDSMQNESEDVAE